MSKKVYTKTGDKGYTSLLGGTKTLKNSLKIEAYGTVDELNSFMGLLNDYLSSDSGKFVNTTLRLTEIQNNLFKIGSILSLDPTKNIGFELPQISMEDVEKLELWIDQMDDQLPELKNFIIPGGHVFVSTSHICRTICRRAERKCIIESIPDEILIYLNRLSDYLFVLSRYIAFRLKIDEKIWKI